MSSVVISNQFGPVASGENLEYIPAQGAEYQITVTPRGDGDGGTPVTIVGANENDSIDLGAAGSSTALGLDGDDMIMGGDGKDLLDGGEGNDTLMGGLGKDVLKGGLGSDVFEFDAADFAAGGIDMIVDFDESVDSIKIMGVTEDSVSYNASSGLVSVDGEAGINIGRGLDDVQFDFDDEGDFEIV